MLTYPYQNFPKFTKYFQIIFPCIDPIKDTGSTGGGGGSGSGSTGDDNEEKCLNLFECKNDHEQTGYDMLRLTDMDSEGIVLRSLFFMLYFSKAAEYASAGKTHLPDIPSFNLGSIIHTIHIMCVHIFFL